MLRDTAMLLFIPCALAMGTWALSGSSRASIQQVDGPEGIASQRSVAERLALRQENRRRFVLLLLPTLEDLRAGRLTLRQTSEKVIAYSRRHHADYLANVSWVETGSTLLEKVARNCVRHFVDLDEDDRVVGPTRAPCGLETQLAALCAEEAESAACAGPTGPTYGSPGR
jgi:hypothetical protein